jgi:hypothetical protein
MIAETTGGGAARADRHFDTFYSAINSELQSIDLKLARVKYPHDKKVYVGIVNTVRACINLHKQRPSTQTPSRRGPPCMDDCA